MLFCPSGITLHFFSGVGYGNFFVLPAGLVFFKALLEKKFSTMGTRAAGFIIQLVPCQIFSILQWQSPDLVDKRTHFLDPKLRLPIIIKNYS
jgi:hypothetical protein